MRFQESPVLIVHDGDRCARRAIGSDRRERKNRLVICDTETFHRIQRLAAADSEHHVRFLIERQAAQMFHCGICTILPVDFFSDDLKICFLHIRTDLAVSRIQSFSSADHKDLLPVGFTDRSDLVINPVPDRIIREMYFIIFQFHNAFLLSVSESGQNKKPSSHTIYLQGQEL